MEEKSVLEMWNIKGGRQDSIPGSLNL